MNYLIGGNEDPILDLGGIEITAYYSDGSTRILDFDEWASSLVDGDDLSVAEPDENGLVQIVVSYEEDGDTVTTFFNIGVWADGGNVPAEKTLIGIIVTALPKWVYTYGDEFDTAGMEVTACFYDPGAPDLTSTEVVTDECTLDPENGAAMLRAGVIGIGVSYSREEEGGVNTQETSFDVLVNSTTPRVRTDPVSDIGSSGAVLSGEIIGDGGLDLIEFGFLYSTGNNPSLGSGTRVAAENDRGRLTATLTSLAPGTTYYVRAYAVNSDGVSYGEIRSFGTTGGYIPEYYPPAVKDEEEFNDDDKVPLTPYIPSPFTEDHIPYINGYPDGTVRPDRAITRAEAAMVFYRLLKDHPEAAGGRFSDVPDGEWYAEAVNCLAELGIIDGYPDGSFKPDATMTRAEFATLASRFDELGAVDADIFEDVPPTHWAVAYINSAYAKGWINGYPDGTFKPEGLITRGEVVTLVNAMLSRKIDADALSAVECPFPDIGAGHWAYAEIIEASAPHEYERDEDGNEIWTEW